MKKDFLKKTLIDLLYIESFSEHETTVVNYILPILKKAGFVISQDQRGNVYCVRGKSESYPLLNAHMDCVKGYKKPVKKFTKAKETENCNKCAYGTQTGSSHLTPCNCGIKGMTVDYWKAYSCEDYITEKDYKLLFEGEEGEEEELNEIPEPVKEEEKFVLYYNETTKKITSNETRPMGGDDKCGIAIALDIACSTTIPLKLLFTVEEETGCNGAKYSYENHNYWFEDVAYGLTIDRRGSNHICVSTGGERSASNYFISELSKWAIISGIFPSFEKGSMSDNFILKYLVPNFINISAGYYNAHRNSEYIMFDEVKLIKTWVKNFLLKGDIKC